MGPSTRVSRMLTATAALALLLGCAACGGSDDPASAPSTSVVTSAAVVPTSTPEAATSAPTTAAASASPSAVIHPAKQLRTVNVTTGTGQTLPVTIWAEDHITDCQNHAYGEQMVKFLTSNPCVGADRQLMTTQVNGKDVGISLVLPQFNPGADPSNANADAVAFKNLVTKDGTGSINDLLRDGYRLPSGPTKIPSPDAFSALNEDNGVGVFDMWYLSGPTANNAPELVALAPELFLQTTGS